MDKGKYREAMELSPPTRWTRIVQTGCTDPESALKAIHELVQFYDKPLEKLFVAVCSDQCDQAMDWKQDFVTDRCLPGKIFTSANRARGHFRTFLAVAVRNYVANRRKHDRTRKQLTGAGAKPLWQFSDEGLPEAVFSADPTDDFCIETLTRARAWDLYREALNGMAAWVAAQDDAASLAKVLAEIREAATHEDVTIPKSLRGRAHKRFFAQLRRVLGECVHAELLLPEGSGRFGAIDEEIDIFLGALKQR